MGRRVGVETSGCKPSFTGDGPEAPCRRAALLSAIEPAAQTRTQRGGRAGRATPDAHHGDKHQKDAQACGHHRHDTHLLAVRPVGGGQPQGEKNAATQDQRAPPGTAPRQRKRAALAPPLTGSRPGRGIGGRGDCDVLLLLKVPAQSENGVVGRGTGHSRDMDKEGQPTTAQARTKPEWSICKRPATHSQPRTAGL